MELYHVLNRGVEKRQLFMDDRDRLRFVHNLYEFNDTAPAPEFTKYREIVTPDMREKIVDIHGWCIMGNHYHLLLSDRIDGGISQFMRKLNIGYAMYFNERHKRSGTLFQGRTKKILIDSDGHFLHILHYIHLNPLDFLKGAEHWRTMSITKADAALEHVGSYKWSSYQDYIGRKNFPSLITTDLYSDVFKDYKGFIESHLRELEVPLPTKYALE